MDNLQNKRLAEIIKNLSTQKGVSINQMLKECSLSKSLVYDIEVRGSIPSVEKIVKIADYFNVSVDYLLGRPDYMIKDVNGNMVIIEAMSPPLNDDFSDLTDVEYQELLKYADFLRAKRN